MTKEQYKICKFILKCNRLYEVTQKFNLDYSDLQYKLGLGALEFSDDNMDENTQITLTDGILDIYEKYHRELVDTRITRAIAFYGAVTGTISLLIYIVQAFL